jgi:hypothetical protein
VASSFGSLDFIRRVFASIGVKDPEVDKRVRALPERRYDRATLTTAKDSTFKTSGASAIDASLLTVPADEDWLLMSVGCYSLTDVLIAHGDATYVGAWLSPRDSNGRIAIPICRSHQPYDNASVTLGKLHAVAPKAHILEHGDSLYLGCCLANVGANPANATFFMEFLAYRYPRGMAPWAW